MQDQTTRKLLTEEEICEYLRVSRPAILKFKRDPLDPIPYLKVGRRFLYDLAKVEKWGERNGRRYRERKTG